MELIVYAYIGLAIWLNRYFYTRDRGGKEPAYAIRNACLFGVGAVIAAGSLNAILVPRAIFEAIGNPELVRLPVSQLLTGALLIGVIEESVKFVPLALYIFRKRYFDELTDGVVYFALCGMWFGVIESLMYTFEYGAGVGVMRLVMAPFLHAGFTAIAGIGLIRFKLLGHKKHTIIIWFGLAILLHAAYDFFLFMREPLFALMALAIAIYVNLRPFYFYRMTQKADEKMGLSAIGDNSVCRSCGQANPKRDLFCTQCGRKT